MKDETKTQTTDLYWESYLIEEDPLDGLTLLPQLNTVLGTREGYVCRENLRVGKGTETECEGVVNEDLYRKIDHDGVCDYHW